MSTTFRYLSTKFYNAYYNDDGTETFPNNLSDFTPYLKGNQGELVKVVRQFEVSATVNEFQNITLKYVATSDATYGTFISNSLNWREEGLFDGCDVDVIINRGQKTIATVAVDTISGKSNSVLRLEKAQLGDLEDGKEYTDITVKLITAPKWLTYKYGLIDVNANQVDFQSQIDSSEQAYYNKAIPNIASPASMTLLGNDTGSDQTVALTIAYDNVNSSKYLFIYEIAHTFYIPYYRDGEFGNLLTGTIPRRGSRPVNMKYCSGYYMGGSTSDAAVQFEDIGSTGDVGYFNQNFGGRALNFAVSDFAVSNASNTGKIELTEANTITFTITNNGPAGLFSGGEEIILYHSRLPSDNESAYKTDAWEDVWAFEAIRQTEGAGAVAGTRWSAVTVTLNAGELDVSAVLTPTSADQALMTSIDNNIIYFTIADDSSTDPENTDRANVIAKAGQYSKDTDITGIITAHQPTIYPESEFDGGTGYSNFDGYNGDLLGYSGTFTVDNTETPRITAVRFMVVADDGSDYFELFGYSFPVTNVQLTGTVPNTNQILNIDNTLDFNIPTTELINRASLEATNPTLVSSTQTWNIEIGFQIPWREWISNQNIPLSFIDYAEENNNLNNRTSNYSGVGSWTIKTMIRVQTQVDDSTSQTSITTFYELFSDSSTILNFDDAGGGGFSLSWNYYDESGDATSDLFINQDVQIDAVFAHSLGTISTSNLFGYMWILPEDGVGQPWFLSTDLDLTNANNLLVPTDTLSTGNDQYVEVISTNNQVILRCKTEKNNLNLNQSYKVYARLYPK